MLDIKFIRENIDLLIKIANQKNIRAKDAADNEQLFKKLLQADDSRRKLLRKIEEIRTKKNAFSKSLPELNEAQKSVELEKMKVIDAEEEKLKEELTKVEEAFQRWMLEVPMYVSPETPIGADESANVEIERVGSAPQFCFPPKDHIQLGKELDIIDLERAAKIGGARSYLLKGDGARLELALIKYAADFIARKGFTLMSVPVVVDKFALVGTGFIPGAEEEIYYLQKDDKYLVGTSEVAIGAYHADEILEEKDLPIRFAAYSVCFRREAGAYGKDTRGLYRMHQFLKVEQFIICKNEIEESVKYHKELMNNSKEFLQSLNLPFRVLNICTADMGKGKYYMNDIETWMPSRGNYGETHSCSALLDFQARRLGLRFRDKSGKINFCHTLNNTVVATPRILIPILEINQNPDASVNIPEALRPYMDNQEKITMTRACHASRPSA
ncbi:serine--tRNA ligase [Candidatus Falkowbacteria bacterium]|nr:serine--tRNA ligase [Candidatus Falkowbacteria bacterium]